MKIRPLTLSSEERIDDVGRRVVRCWTKMNPHYFESGDGSLQPIDLSQVDQVLGATESLIKGRNIVSVGTPNKGSKDKFLGLRPSRHALSGDQQLEFSLIHAHVNGQRFDKFSKPICNAYGYVLGPMHIIVTRQFTRFGFRVNSGITEFDVEFRIDAKGMEYRKVGNEYWFGSSRDSIIKLVQPVISTEDGNPINLAELGYQDDFSSLIGHSLEKVGNHFVYRKWAKPDLGLLPISSPVVVDGTAYYSSTSDGPIYSVDFDSWAEARSGSADSVMAYPLASSFPCVSGELRDSDPDYWDIVRSFFYFDTSGITDTDGITDCDLKIYIYDLGADGCTIVALPGEQSDPLTTGDWDSYTDLPLGSLLVPGTGSHITIPLNVIGRSLIDRGGETKIVIMEYDHDYLNSAPTLGDWHYASAHFTEWAGTSDDPYLDVTTGGYGHKPIGYFPSKVNGVAAPTKVCGT